MIEIRVADELTAGEIDQLADLLAAVVADGASIGFLASPARAEAARYWLGVLSPGVQLLLAEADGQIVGAVQLQAASSANGRHRGEVAKLMVSPDHRRQGIGRRLMEALEAAALRDGRWLLVLDTREGDPSNALYRSLGYVEVGRIPRYARSRDGGLAATVHYYKELVPPA